jgi:long-chain acyl-CoA synthetase
MTSGTTSGPPADGSADRPGDVSALLRTAAARFGDRTALISPDGSRTWAELDRAVDAGAGVLVRSPLLAGSRVIVSMETGQDIIVALFAVARAGMIAVPIGPSRADLTDIAGKVGAAGAIAGQADIPVGVLIRPADVACWWPVHAEPADAVDTSPVGAILDPEDIAVLARAASSDRPVMVSHRAIVAAVTAISATPRLALRADDRAILVLPSYHLAGWVTAFLPLAVVGAAAVIPDAPADGKSWLDQVLVAVRERRVTIIPGAPSLYRRLRTASGVERALASVRLMTSGAAPLDPEDSAAMHTLVGQPVWEGYGISESASVVSTSLMTTASRTGSVGLPLPGLKVRIVGDDGDDLYADTDAQDQSTSGPEALGAETGARGEVGRIQISGTTLFSGYWPEGTDGVDDEGWFATGDLGYLDDVGELHLVDRAAETIRVAGFTVYPREIERVLMQHPYVRDAAVIGVQGRAGQAFAAVLVPWWGTHPSDADLDEFVAARLPVFKRPQSFHLVDRLPRNEIGRIDRDAVRTLYRSATSLAPATTLDPGARDDSGLPVTAASGPAPVKPESAAGLDELGARLPGTGERDRRGDQDTDDDLF